MSLRARLEAMLAAGNDTPALRLALGTRCLDEGDADAAIGHLEVAVAQDPDYSAAWKLLGKARAQSGRSGEAIEAYRRGIAAAEGRGDRQAAKEMQVFMKRLQGGSG